MKLKLFLISFIILGFSASAFAQVAQTSTSAPSYPHPAGSTFTPVTAPPTLPPVNSQAAQNEESAVSTENSAAEQAVTQTKEQVNSTLNSTTTQQDINAKTGTDTTYSGGSQNSNSNSK
jgi:hypothetical protein